MKFLFVRFMVGYYVKKRIIAVAIAPNPRAAF